MKPICPTCGAHALEKLNAKIGDPKIFAICDKCGEFTLERRRGIKFVLTRTSDPYGKVPQIFEATFEDIMALVAKHQTVRIKHRSLQVQEPMPEIEIVDAYD